MKQKTPLAVALLAMAFLAAAYGVAYYSGPSFLVKDSKTSLMIDSPLALDRDGSRGATVTAIGHSYDPTGIRIFVSRVYSFVSGAEFSLDWSDVTMLRLRPVFFINRSRDDLSSPVAANFTVDWIIEGEGHHGKRLLDEGVYMGRTIDTSLSEPPSGMEDFSENLTGKYLMELNFSELDSEFIGNGTEGSYNISITGKARYALVSWSGSNVSNSTEYTIFRGQVNYNRSERMVSFYYPATFFTEELRITHPFLIRIKKLFGTL
jgi:hypothetical protein